jgi:hypothetical protein
VRTMPEPTDDPGHARSRGDRRRESVPTIPHALHRELVEELGRARRAVEEEGDAARPRVRDAEIALGERDAAEPTDLSTSESLTSTIRALLRHRAGTTICPSDAARVVGGTRWRALMDAARETAFSLADADVVVVTQKGEPVGRDARGPLRIGPGPGLRT